MLTLVTVITAVIIVLAVLNLIRMAVYVVGADVYTIRKTRSKSVADYRPTVSLVVPMHNEGPIVERTLANLLAIDYHPLQIIVVDDGSTDDTAARIAAFKLAHDQLGGHVIEAFSKTNGGKAHALNTAISTRAIGELVMCLDGDSLIAPDAVTKSVAYFADETVVASASNVNILPGGGVLGLVQRYEYLISYHMKKAHNLFNVEYIIGGIGSMFRRRVLDEVGGYDTNTMTEDIDLTMKILLARGNKNSRVVYAADALTYTEAVESFTSLVAQRYRWKYGRMQSFLKYGRLFFSTDRKHSRALGWVMLPHAVLQEVLYLAEPIIITTIIAVSIYFHSPATLISAIVTISLYIIANILGTAHLSRKDKALLCLASPLMYGFFYLLALVEYLALVQAIIRLPRLRASISEEKVTWRSPERTGAVLAT